MTHQIKTEVYDSVAQTKTWVNLNADISGGEIIYDDAICIKSADDTVWKLTVSNAGALVITAA